MSFVPRPWQLFFLILSGWVNRQQQEIIEFQNAQIRGSSLLLHRFDDLLGAEVVKVAVRHRDPAVDDVPLTPRCSRCT